MTSQSGGPSSYMIDSSLMTMSLKASKIGEERIRVGKEEDGTNAFNHAFDKFQGNQNKAQTRHILELAWRKIRGRIKQWQLVLIISTAIQNIPAKVWTDTFVAVNLHPRHRMTFPD